MIAPLDTVNEQDENSSSLQRDLTAEHHLMKLRELYPALFIEQKKSITMREVKDYTDSLGELNFE